MPILFSLPYLCSMSRLAQNLTFLRKQRKMTQHQFADLFKVKKAVIGSYEEGRAEPKLKFLNKVAKTYNLSLDDLVNKNLFSKKIEELVTSELKVYVQNNKKLKPTNRKCFLPVDLNSKTVLIMHEKDNKYFSSGAFLVAHPVEKLTELNQHDVLLDINTGVIEKVSHINFSNSDYYKILYALEKVNGREKNPSLEMLTNTVLDLQTQLLDMKKNG